MNTIEKIRSEIQKVLDAEGDSESAKAQALALFWVLELFDKYAEQEPCENCCNGNQIEKAKLCQKSYLAGMEHKQEPCEDAVSRQAVLEIAKQHTLTNDYLAIQDLPSVRPQEQTGKWVEIDEEPHEVWECGHCGFVIDGSGCIDPYDYRDTYKFCPNCGAKMVEPKESEDKE